MFKLEMLIYEIFFMGYPVVATYVARNFFPSYKNGLELNMNRTYKKTHYKKVQEMNGL